MNFSSNSAYKIIIWSALLHSVHPSKKAYKLARLNETYLFSGLVVNFLSKGVNFSGILLVSWARLATVLGGEGVESLESDVELGRTIKLSKICNQKLWLFDGLFKAQLEYGEWNRVVSLIAPIIKHGHHN